MSEYTPDTDELRTAWAARTYACGLTSERGEVEFDRWLSAHDESVRAEARAEGGWELFARQLLDKLNAMQAQRDDQRDRAKAAEADRDALQRIIDGYDRTPAEERAARAEAVIEKVRERVESYKFDIEPGPAVSVIAVTQVLDEAPSAVLAERDARIRAERDALADEVSLAEKLIPGIPYRDFDELAETEQRWAARAERFPAPHDTEAN